MSEIHYQFDEHLPTDAALSLRGEDIDVATAADLGLLGVADHLVLARAHASSRAMVTRDRDYLRLNKLGQPHSGIVFVGRKVRTICDLVEALLLVHGAISAEEMIGHVEYM